MMIAGYLSSFQAVFEAYKERELPKLKEDVRSIYILQYTADLDFEQHPGLRLQQYQVQLSNFWSYSDAY